MSDPAKHRLPPARRDLAGAQPRAGAQAYSPAYATSWAVVIGIDGYTGGIPPLSYAVRDADSFARLLVTDLGFQKEHVFVILDPLPTAGDAPYTLAAPHASRDAIEELLLSELPEKTGPDDRLLVFFAGHGERRILPSGEHKGYLLPADARAGRWNTFIATDDVIEAGNFCAAKHVFYLLDACYSGLAFSRTVIKPSPYEETMLTNRARMALTAGTAREAVSDQGPGGHSPFTWYVLQGLRGEAAQPQSSVVTASDLMIYVKNEVGLHYGRQQTPDFGKLPGHESGGDFIFRLPPLHPAEAQSDNQASATAEAAVPLTHWPVWLTPLRLLLGLLLLAVFTGVVLFGSWLYSGVKSQYALQTSQALATIIQIDAETAIAEATQAQTTAVASYEIAYATETRQAFFHYLGKIVFSVEDGAQTNLYTMFADGMDLVRLTSNPGKNLNPAWSPDGSKIAFSSSRDGNYQIHIINPDGSDQTRITQNSSDERNPTWSPDGTQIAFDTDRQGGRDIYVMDASGARQTRLTTTDQNEYSPAWSPDGAWIVFVSDRDGNPEIYRMKPDGSEQTRLTHTAGAENRPSWSPDSRQIAYASNLNGYFEIVIQNADDSGTSRWINLAQGEGLPSWSPDGDWIAYASGGQIKLTKVDRSETRNLSPEGMSCYDFDFGW